MIVRVAVPQRFQLKMAAGFGDMLFHRTNEVHYIGGTEVLPPPLTAGQEQELLAMLGKEGDAKARSQLIERNLRLVVYIAKKFDNTGVGVEDLISIGTIGLIKAINTFKAEKNNKLATYASRCIENEILMYIRKNSARRCEISIEEPLSVDWDGNELLLSDVLGSDEDMVYRNLESSEEKRVLRTAVEGLCPRERLIVELRYGLGGGGEKTQKEVADMLGISQSYISRLEKKIISRLKGEVVGKI